MISNERSHAGARPLAWPRLPRLGRAPSMLPAAPSLRAPETLLGDRIRPEMTVLGAGAADRLLHAADRADDRSDGRGDRRRSPAEDDRRPDPRARRAGSWTDRGRRLHQRDLGLEARPGTSTSPSSSTCSTRSATASGSSSSCSTPCAREAGYPPRTKGHVPARRSTRSWLSQNDGFRPSGTCASAPRLRFSRSPDRARLRQRRGREEEREHQRLDPPTRFPMTRRTVRPRSSFRLPPRDPGSPRRAARPGHLLHRGRRPGDRRGRGAAVASRFFAVGTVVPWAKAGVGAAATQACANTSFEPNGSS